MLGAFMLLRRTMLDEIGGWDAGFRIYSRTSTSTTAPRRRAGSAGTCRRGRPPRVRGRDRQAVPVAPHALARARHAALPAQASRAAARAVSELERSTRGQAEAGARRQYADAARYLRHRAELVVALGPPLEPGDDVLDLACGDGGLADFLRSSATSASTRAG